MSIATDRGALSAIFALATESSVESYTYTIPGTTQTRTVDVPCYVIPNPRWPDEPLHVYDVRAVFPDSASGNRTSRAPKNGVVCHHDAVAFPPHEQWYDGHTVERGFQRAHKVWVYHRDSMNWGGTGYMAMHDSEGRVYITGDVSESRAHTIGSDGPYMANETQYGSCMMGLYTMRPNELTLHSLDGWWQLLANVLDRELTARGHKDWQSDTRCPGDWFTRGNWASVRFVPQDADVPDDPDDGDDPPIEDMRDWYHFVQPGETLSSIAHQVGIPLFVLRHTNHQIVDENLIEVGQALRLREDVPLPPLIPIAGKTDNSEALEFLREAKAALAKAKQSLGVSDV